MSIARTDSFAESGSLLGRGIYDVIEVARLVDRDPETVALWTSGRTPLHPVEARPFYAFLDLISIWVISELVRRKVPKGEIRRGAKYVSNQLNTEYPFAHRAIATVGSAVFGEFGEWIDVGKSGQMAFQSVIENYVKPVEYGRDGLATVWRPAAGVWINPKVQAGSPCVEGTRIPTALLAALASEDQNADDLADDYDLELSQVRAALRFERAA